MANFIVTNLNNSGAGSLRDAVTKANANVDADVITFAVGGTITLTTELALTNDVTIDGDINGDDRADVTISGGGTTRIFNQTGFTTDVGLLSLTLENGNTGAGNYDGGAILVNYGSLLIGNTTLRNNVAGDDGGAIRTQGTALAIYNSLLHNNSAAHGGGLYIDGNATTTIYSSTIHNNIASVNGGGVYIDGGNTLNLIQSTVTSNMADADNNGSGDGGGIFLFSTTENLNTVNSVIATNFDAAVANDVTGTIDSAIHSVFGTVVTITANTNSLQNVGNPGLNSLGERGGTVLTQNMVAESVLINAGFDNGNLPSNDMNGNPRIVAGTVDVGATEFQLVVTTDLDVVANDGFLSLREAVALANEDAGADVITFSANIAGSTIILGSQLNLTSDISINGDTDGDRRADITLSGADLARIITQSGATTDLRLESLNFIDGKATGDGGAVYAFGGGTLDIRYSVFSNNYASDNGGAVMLSNMTANITGSTFVSNSAEDGGAIYAVGSSPTTISNTTVHLNAATDRGGGVYIDGNATISNSTITENRSDANGVSGGSGGGVFKFNDSGETLSIRNTVVANNFNGSGSTLQDVNTGMSSQVFGLNSAFSTNADVAINGGTLLNQSLAQLDLGTFADNGGPVFTRALGANSVLIDAGRNVYAVGNEDAIGGNRIAGNRVDIGAVEQQLMVTNTNNAGFGSLRAAVDAANANADHSTITFAANLAGQTITLLTQLELTSDITLDGDVNNDNIADITLSGGTTTRILTQTGTDTDVKLMSMTLTGGSSTYGGAIYINGYSGSSLEIRNSNLLNNVSTQKGGALISNNADTTIINTLVQGNSASKGGGLYIYGGNNSVVNSTIVNNSSTDVGGGIYIDGVLSVFNSTITGNRANSDGIGTEQGGGIFKFADAGGPLSILNTVLADNVIGTGSTLNDVNGGVTAQIQVRNSAFGSAAAASITSYGTNLFGQTKAQLALGELLDNGGTTLTRSMLDGSVLINAGANGFGPIDTTDIDADGNRTETLPLDGRGGPRVTGVVDIGAVEQIVDETIRGTAGNNNIIGGLGIDNLSGLGGDDVISGGAGADHIDGGAGTGDTADYRTSTGVIVNINLLLDTAFGGEAQGDTLDGIENLLGSLTVRDSLVGNLNNNIIKGFGGNDSLRGGGGDDFLEGGSGGDAINGDAGTSDTASYRDSNTGTVSINMLTLAYSGGDAQGDTLFFIENLEGSLTRRDILVGNNIINRIFGNGGIDSIRGEGGNDFIDGGTGGDSLNAGAGVDTVSYENSATGVTIDLNVAAQTSGGDAAGDNLNFFENVNGSSSADSIKGNYQSNRLVGGAGADTLNGGTGSDYLTGGADADTFRFSDMSFGADTILDWQDGLDKISVAPVLESSFAGLTFTGNGTTQVIVRGFNGTGSAITVKADAAFTLDATDFLFV